MNLEGCFVNQIVVKIILDILGEMSYMFPVPTHGGACAQRGSCGSGAVASSREVNALSLPGRPKSQDTRPASRGPPVQAAPSEWRSAGKGRSKVSTPRAACGEAEKTAARGRSAPADRLQPP